MFQYLRISRLLIIAQVKTILVITLCLSASIFAFLINITPSISRIEWGSRGTENTSFFLTFEQGQYDSLSSERMSDVFAKHLTIAGQSLSSGYYLSFLEDSPLLIGFFNGETDRNRWFVLDEGRYFSLQEERESKPVSIVSYSLFPEGVFDLSHHRVVESGLDLSVVGLARIGANNFFIGMSELFQQIAPAAIRDNPVATSIAHIEEHSELQSLVDRYEYLSSVIVIPYTLYKDYNYKPNMVVLSFDGVTSSNRSQIALELKELFPQSRVYPSLTAAQSLAGYTQRDLRFGILLSSVSILFILTMLFFWLETNRRNYAVLFTTGYSQRSISLITVLILLIILFSPMHCHSF